MRSAAAATALGITLTIAGLSSCASPAPHGFTPAPEPSGTPVFASEEEALAAAEDAYTAFLAATDAVGQTGWRDVEPLAEVARGAALESETESAADFAANGWTQIGGASFDSLTLQQLDDGGAGSVEIVVYLCLIVSQIDVVDATGVSVVSADRPDRQPREVTFDDQDKVLKVSRSDSWSGDNFC